MFMTFMNLSDKKRNLCSLSSMSICLFKALYRLVILKRIVLKFRKTLYHLPYFNVVKTITYRMDQL